MESVEFHFQVTIFVLTFSRFSRCTESCLNVHSFFISAFSRVFRDSGRVFQEITAHTKEVGALSWLWLVVLTRRQRFCISVKPRAATSLMNQCFVATQVQVTGMVSYFKSL